MSKTATTTPPAMLDVREVAALLKCSTRTVTRMHKEQQMPRAVRFGRLCRWNRAAIDQWIADGCPALNAEVKK
jgi:excisionase family DNA binding protein